jgi:hypothetical protein
MGSKNKIARAYGMCGDKERCIQAFVGKPKENRQLGKPRHKQIILKCVLKKLGRRVWTGLIWLRVGTSGRLL